MTVSGFECVSKGSAQVAKRHAKASKGVARVVRVAGKTFKTSPVVSYHSSAASWLGVARTYKGQTGRQLAVKHRRLWCGEFVCKVMAQSGKPCPPGYAKATSWAAGRRLSGPQVGAIAVYRHHVGIVADVNPDGSIILLSGNYNDRVHEGPYRSRGLIGYYWPEA